MQDTTTGAVVAQHRMRQGPCSVLRQNPWNGVMLTGHVNGTVQMWTPNLPQAAVKMLCHRVQIVTNAAPVCFVWCHESCMCEGW